MKTEVIMKRDMDGHSVSQNHKTQMFRANDLLDVANRMGAKKIMANYFLIDTTENLIHQICREENISEKEVKKTTSGRNGGTWMHPILFIDFAMWLSPEFRYKALRWVKDGLLETRDASGESFKTMMNVLSETFPDEFERPIIYASIANQIAAACAVGISKDRWQTATKEQLALRDKIQNNIMFIAPTSASAFDAVSLGVNRTLELNEVSK